MSGGIESQAQQWPHRVAALKISAPTDWSQARPGPLVDTPLREQDPDDVFSSRPYSGPTCSICGRPTPMVSGPYCRHGVRVRLAMPMPTNLQLSGEQPDYTGSHGMQVMQDAQGDWSFKQPKPSLAFTVPLEAAATDLQRKVGLEAPESYAITHQGKPAVVSKWYPNSTQAFHKPPHINELSPDDHMEIQKNHALDWLIGNHDSHVGNWMRTQDGKLVSIDKGQAAKYFGHDRLDPQFHPNYYAREPIYNQLWRDHAAGRGQMHDPRTGELGAFVKQVQSIPDDHLKEMFRPYAESAARSGLLANPDGDPSRELGPRTLPANSPEHFLDALVARKNNLHKDLGDYYDRMSGKGREFVGATRGRGRPPSIPYEQNPNPLPLEHFGPEPDGRLYNQSEVIDHMGMSSNGFRALVKNRQAPAPSHLTPTGKPVWQDLRHWDYWRTNGGDSPHQDPPGTIHSINEVAKGLGISSTLMRNTIHESGDIPPHTHTVGDSPRWDSLQPWREWLDKRPRTLRGRPRNDGQLSPTHVDWSPPSHTAAAGPGVAEAQGDRLYLPGDVADHLGVPRPTLTTWIYNKETPTPTHTSEPHEEMWDNLDVWDKWYTRRRSLKAGPRGYPDGWAAEFQSNKKPQRMLTIPDISQETGMSLSDVYKSVYRPESTSARLPRNTHFAIGDDKRGVHFWDTLRPTRKREQGTGSRTSGFINHHTASEDGIALAQWLGWCMHRRKPADRSSLSEYAAISGMDPESYLDIYMFLANSDNGIFRDAAGG